MYGWIFDELRIFVTRLVFNVSVRYFHVAINVRFFFFHFIESVCKLRCFINVTTVTRICTKRYTDKFFDLPKKQKKKN